MDTKLISIPYRRDVSGRTRFTNSFLAGLSCTIGLIGCGGGAEDQHSPAAAISLAATTVVAGSAFTPAPPVSWTQCAASGLPCSFDGTRQVRYGANGIYFYQTATGAIQCDDTVFGNPLPGVQKYCDYSSSAPVPTDAVFAPASFWYTALPVNAPLHPNSAGFVADFLRQKQAYYGTVNINTWSYASPVYIADANTPTTKVTYSNCQRKYFPETALEAQWAAVPIPAYAMPANGADAEMTIYQPSTNSIWEFWVTHNVAGKWDACWGGKMSNTNTSDGTWPHPYGTTATGLPFLGGQVTAEELTRGEIRHAIGISLVETERAAILSWPAKRSDGINPALAPNRIPEGLRFRLDPAVNVDALPMTYAGKIIAKAAQKYGFVVWDKAGAISIRAQNPRSYTALGQADPYIAIFGGKPSYAILNGMPWERLQFMPMDYGKP
jgi:hypothetical protein